tara:strand:+ start:90 stop:539 length:450 start_codon:yes stop_codon:yes gene_type:complete
MKRSSLDIAKHFYRICTETQHGRLLLAVWGSFSAGVLLLALKPRKKKQRRRGAEQLTDAKQRKKKQKKQSSAADVAFASMIASLRAHVGGALGTTMFLYTASLSVRIFITAKIAKIGGHLGSYFGAREWSAMFNNQVRFGLWCMLAAGT